MLYFKRNVIKVTKVSDAVPMEKRDRLIYCAGHCSVRVLIFNVLRM